MHTQRNTITPRTTRAMPLTDTIGAMHATANPAAPAADKVGDKIGDSVRAVERALDILMAFTSREPELSAAALLQRVDLSRPTLYRLLRTLEHSGFVISHGDPQRFRLGPSVAHLVQVWSAGLDLQGLAQPMLRQLWQETGETVALYARDGLYRVCVAELPSAQPLSFRRGLGYRERLFVGASGRVILAHLQGVEKELAAYLRETRTDAARYAKNLEHIRRRGYEVSKGELVPGAVAVAAPYFGPGGQVAGAMTVFGPSTRMTALHIGRCAGELVRHTKSLSQSLGQLQR